MSSPTPPAEPGPHGPHPVVLGLASAVLLWLAFPPMNWGWLAWVALVPLFLLVPSRRRRGRSTSAAWAGGMAFWTLAIQWVRLTDESAWLAWLVMALALSAFWPAFLALTRLAVRRLDLPLMLAAPVVWVGLEYVRAFILSGFPWYYLAHSQHAVLPVIQAADLTGSLGVSFVIAVVNAWVVDLITLPLLRPTADGPRLTGPAVVAARRSSWRSCSSATLGYGAFRLATARFRPGPRVALIQSSFVQRYKDVGTTRPSIEAVYRPGRPRAPLGTPPRPDRLARDLVPLRLRRDRAGARRGRARPPDQAAQPDVHGPTSGGSATRSSPTCTG